MDDWLPRGAGGGGACVAAAASQAPMARPPPPFALLRYLPMPAMRRASSPPGRHAHRPLAVVPVLDAGKELAAYGAGTRLGEVVAGGTKN